MVKNKNKPLVSVIIPAYNAEKYLSESVDSILAQSYKNIEVIIINDASKDATLEIAKKYNKNKNVRIYNNEHNLGIGKNRSLGVRLARGKYICWQDADDISLSDRVKDQVSYLESHPSVGVVGGFIQFFDKYGDKLIRRYKEKDLDLRSKIFRYNPVAQPASMFRAEVYEKVGGYDPDLRVSEDLDMLLRTGEKYEFANVQKLVLKYRQIDDSLTRSSLRKMEKATLRLRKKYSSSKSYHFTIIDRVYNYAQMLSMIMPSKIRIFIFGLIRGDK